MKRKAYITTIILVLFPLLSYCQGISAYINDLSDTPTNIRNSPKGSIVYTIPTDLSVMLTLKTPKNGWWRIEGDSYELAEEGREIELDGSRTGYWIHYSCLSVSTRNYGGERLKLYTTPSKKGRVGFSFTDEIEVRPIDIRGNWVKVVTLPGNYCGWIEVEWLCGNPLTNCI